MIEDSPEYYVFNNYENITFFGLRMGQNRIAINAVSIFLNKIKPNTIVEFGSGQGGLSVLIGLFALINHTEYITYDTTDNCLYKDLFDILKINRKQEDIFSEKTFENICKTIQQDGVTVVFADNGDKKRELKEFSKFLKSGDYILVHDYTENDDFFTTNIKDKFWSWHEVSLCDSDNLDIIPAYTKLFEYGVWGCFQKI